MAVAIGLDGDCDVAAMTYAPGESPDELLAAFAADLTGQGVDVVGVVQRRPGPELVRLPDGAGLSAAIRRDVRRDVPVLLAVPEALFADWLIASGGLSVRLACRRAGLDAWWRSLKVAGRSHDGFCARFK